MKGYGKKTYAYPGNEKTYKMEDLTHEIEVTKKYLELLMEANNNPKNIIIQNDISRIEAIIEKIFVEYNELWNERTQGRCKTLCDWRKLYWASEWDENIKNKAIEEQKLLEEIKEG